eukprot:scaffold2850_cov235-Pinguiococcus_pyrenoidosus.AAC.3
MLPQLGAFEVQRDARSTREGHFQGCDHRSSVTHIMSGGNQIILHQGLHGREKHPQRPRLDLRWEAAVAKLAHNSAQQRGIVASRATVCKARLVELFVARNQLKGGRSEPSLRTARRVGLEDDARPFLKRLEGRIDLPAHVVYDAVGGDHAASRRFDRIRWTFRAFSSAGRRHGQRVLPPVTSGTQRAKHGTHACDGVYKLSSPRGRGRMCVTRSLWWWPHPIDAGPERRRGQRRRSHPHMVQKRLRYGHLGRAPGTLRLRDAFVHRTIRPSRLDGDCWALSDAHGTALRGPIGLSCACQCLGKRNDANVRKGQLGRTDALLLCCQASDRAIDLRRQEPFRADRDRLEDGGQNLEEEPAQVLLIHFFKAVIPGP